MVDILLAAYNGENYIAEQLDSILQQTCRDFRIIIRDDGSRDSTCSILRRYEAEHPDRIRVMVNQPTTGAAKKNFFQLLSDSDSEYVMFCDQDDIWGPDKIALTMNEMDKLEKQYGKAVPLLVHTDLSVADRTGRVIADSFQRYMKLPVQKAFNRLIIQNDVTGCTVMINRCLAEYMRRADQTDRILMHDHWAAMIASVFGKRAYLDIPTMRYRQHGDNSVGAKDAGSISYLYERFRAGRKQFRKELLRSAEQAAYFMEVYGSLPMEAEGKLLLTAYSGLGRMNKLQRIRFYAKYQVWKQGMIRRIMQIVWG